MSQSRKCTRRERHQHNWLVGMRSRWRLRHSHGNVCKKTVLSNGSLLHAYSTNRLEQLRCLRRITWFGLVCWCLCGARGEMPTERRQWWNADVCVLIFEDWSMTELFDEFRLVPDSLSSPLSRDNQHIFNRPGPLTIIREWSCGIREQSSFIWWFLQ